MNKKLRNYWDYLTADGRTYQMGMMSHREYLLDLLKEKGVKSMLDVGCGTGPLYQLVRDTKEVVDDNGPIEMTRWNFKYKGTDYSEGMIDVCKTEFPEGQFEVQDARRLIEPDNSWDAVVLMHCLDHLDDYQSAISEAARVAKKYVLIVLWRGLSPGDENNLNDRSTYGLEGTGKQWEDTFLQDYSEKKLKEAFKKAGLKIVQERDDVEINREGKFNTLFLLEK